MLKHRMESLRKEKDKGVSLVIVLCASAFFVAFAAAILYTAGLLTSQSNARLGQERVRLLAKSYGEVLDSELTTPTEKKNGVGEDADFYSFVNAFLDSSQYSDEVAYEFVLNDTSKNLDAIKNGGYGDLRITLTREQGGDEDASTLSGTIPATGSGNYETIIKGLQKRTVYQYLVQVDVTATYDGESYTYSTEYSRGEQYQLNFSWNGKTIVWSDVDNQWHEGSSSGTVVTPNSEISYRYDTTQTTRCQFTETSVDTGNTDTTEGGDSDAGN